MARVHVFLGGLLAVGFAGTAFLLFVDRQAKHPSVAGAPVTTHSLDSPKRPKVDLSEAQLAGLNARLAVLEQSAKASEIAPREADDLDEQRGFVPPEERGEDDQRVARESLDTYQARLEEEAVEAAWDTEFRERIATIARLPELNAVAIESIRCGSTICRVDAGVSEDSTEAMHVLADAIAHAAPHGGIWLNNSLAGERRVIAFVARQRSPLPNGAEPG